MVNLRRYSWAIVLLVFIGTVFVGCGGAGGGLASGGHPVSMFSPRGDLSITISNPPGEEAPIVTSSTTTTTTTTSTATSTSDTILPSGVAVFRIRALDPDSGQDLITPVVVRPTSGSSVTTVTLNSVPAGPVLIVVAGLDSSFNVLTRGTMLITVVAGSSQVADVGLTPVPGVSASPTATATSTPSGPLHPVVVADGGAGTMRTFTIDSTGALHQTGNPATSTSPTPLPVGLAAFQSQNVIYVANHFSQDVTPFQLDATTGIPAPLGSVSLGASLESETVDITQSFLYVLDNSTGLFGFQIAASTGSLTRLSLPSNLLPGGFSGIALATLLDPADLTGKQVLVAADSSSSGLLQPLVLDNATGQLTSDGSPVRVFAAVASLFALGNELFVTANSTGGAQVLRYDVGLTGTLASTPTASATTGGSGASSVVVGSNNFVYVADQNSNDIKVFQNTTGTLPLKSSISLPVSAPGVTFTGQGPTAMAVASSQVGNFLIVACEGVVNVAFQGSPAVDVFSMDSSTGALTPVSETVLPTSPVRSAPVNVLSY